MSSPRSPLAMSVDQRRQFLAEEHVGIVVHAHRGGSAPLASPVWYHYAPGGDVVFVTSAESLKAQHLGDGVEATFLVQQEAPPQRFVAVSGPTQVVAGADEDLRRTIARRHLPVDAIDQFLAVTPADRLVTVTLTPATWRSTDFGKLSAPAASVAP